ncbi:MAG: hypothetical protein ACOYVK_13370 [Bacillota bacterium]
MNKKFTAQQIKSFRDLTALRRDALYNEVQQMSTILNGLSNSYRLLVGAADEFNRVSSASRKDVDDAVDRAKDIGKIIDEVLNALEGKVKVYVKDLKRIDLCRIEFLVYQLEENRILSDEDIRMMSEMVCHFEDRK